MDAAPRYHPFTTAVAARDIDGVVAALAPDAVLHSPVIGTPFEGREVIADLYRSLFEAFEELRVVDEFQNGDTHAFFWEGRIEGRQVAGANRLRIDPVGKVREITVAGRPLSGLAGFLTGVGYHFARRRRGPFVARVLRVTALPLVLLFRAIDVITPWIARGRR